MKKLKDEDGMFYDWYTFERSEKSKENWEKILKNTTLTEQDYLEMQERKLIEKSEQLLKRTNFI